MIACAFVPQGPLDENVIGWRAQIHDLAGRGDAEQKLAAGGEQLFGDEHGERGADGIAHDAAANAAGLPFP